MNIYKHCLEKIAQGASYSIDFKKRSLTLNHKHIIVDGVYEGELHFDKNDDLNDVLLVIEDLYDLYKHSVPSEKTESRRRVYFKALKEKGLDNDDMLYGERRMECMFNLEYYILENILNGSLHWDENIMGTGWFWQSAKDKDLVILRDWIEGR